MKKENINKQQKNLKNRKKDTEFSHKNNAEFSDELDAGGLSWKLFEKTKDLNYYRLYSAIKKGKDPE